MKNTLFITDYRFCEFCGSIGASQAKIQTKHCFESYNLCNKCRQLPSLKDISGLNRAEVLEKVHNNLFFPWAPLSCCFTKDRESSEGTNLCNNCYRPIECTLTFGLNKKAEYYKLIEDYIPLKCKDFKDEVLLCVICLKRILINFVNDIKEQDLPVSVFFNKFENSEYVFKSGIDPKSMDKLVQKLVRQRINSEILSPACSVEEYKQEKLFSCSIEHLTPGDCQLLENNCNMGAISLNDSDDYHYRENINPLIIARYEHGYILDITSIILNGSIKGLMQYRYSTALMKIVRYAVSNSYKFIRFDSTSPLYREFL